MPAMSVRLNRILFGEPDAQGNVRPSQDDTFLTDFFDKLVEAKTEGMVSKQDAEEIAVKRSKKVLDEYKTALAAAQQAKGGAPVGTFVPGSSAGGGRYTREQLKRMTTKQVMAIPKEERERAMRES